MRVLSLFDGIACGLVALKRAGIKVDAYFASEIDKYAIQIATKNHPEIIEIWDVAKVEGGGNLNNIDLIIGGSPCQWFSVAGKMLAFDDPRSKLFFEYVRVLKEVKPKYFLLENVKMKKERVDIISEYLWVQPIEINSSLVSGQNRKRLYWTNIPGITQPEDKGILLKDILQDKVEDRYYTKDSTLISVINWEIRVKTATKLGYEIAENGDGINLSYPTSNTRRGRVARGKSHTLTTQNEANVLINNNDIIVGNQYNNRIFKEKSGTLGTCAGRTNIQGIWLYYKEIKPDYYIRKLTPIEYERLQTLPDNYTEWVSDTQRYKMLGNGWTVDVIKHIFSFIP